MAGSLSRQLPYVFMKLWLPPQMLGPYKQAVPSRIIAMYFKLPPPDVGSLGRQLS